MDETRKATRRKIKALPPETVGLVFEEGGLVGLELSVMQCRFCLNYSATKTAQTLYISRATMTRVQGKALDAIGKVLQ